MSEAPALIRLDSPGGRLVAWIAPEQGAELCGLEWEGRELLYRGRDFSPIAGWTGRAPILWPAIGRTFAPGPEPTAETFKQAPLGWTVDGVDYPMPMHGFARSMPWCVESQTVSILRLVLADSDRTRAYYPFGFRHTLSYLLSDGLLTLCHEVKADNGNTRPMPFVLGNHATFNLPRAAAASPEAVLVSNATDRMLLDPAGRPSGKSAPFTRFASPMAVSVIEPFEVVALSATDEPPWVQLIEPSGLAVTVSNRTMDQAFSPLQFLTLWGDPSGGYLSLEAWLGTPNALANGSGPCLLPGSSLQWTMSIGVKQTR